MYNEVLFIGTTRLTWNISLDRHTEKIPEQPAFIYQSVSTGEGKEGCVCVVKRQSSMMGLVVY